MLRWLTTSLTTSCRASSSDWTARLSLLSMKTRSCSFSSRRRTFFMLSQPTPWPSNTLSTTSFRKCWFSLNTQTRTTSLFKAGHCQPLRSLCVQALFSQTASEFMVVVLLTKPIAWFCRIHHRLRDGLVCRVWSMLPGVVGATLGRRWLSLYGGTVLNHRGLLIHQRPRTTGAW